MPYDCIDFKTIAKIIANLAKSDDCKRGGVFGHNAAGWDNVLNDPTFISELIQPVLQGGCGGAAKRPFAGEEAKGGSIGVPPGDMKSGELFRHDTSTFART